jgi:hypothetical protein
MDEPFKKLITGFKLAERDRENWLPLWQDCYDYCFPQRIGFYAQAPGQSETDDIYDSSPVTAVDEFASRMQAGLTPPFAKWFEFRSGSEIPEENRSKVDTDLDAISTYVWEVLQNSNMDQELHEAYYDLAVGSATILVEEGDADQPVRFTTLPQNEVYLSAGPYGKVDTKFRVRELTLDTIKIIWEKVSVSTEMERMAKGDPEHKFKVIECVKRDWKIKTTETHTFDVFCIEPEHLMFHSVFHGDGAQPMISFRWSKAAGETYGRGPLLSTLPDIRVLNEVVKLGLENGALAITGMWQADDDGVINPDTLELIPGTIIPRSMGSRGLEPLQSPGNFDMGQFILTDMRHNISKALFNEQLGKREGTPMSATEVHERMADLARTIGSAYGRLHSEMVTPVLRRVVHILKKQGRINIPKINGREVKIVNVSPLAQAQHNENVARVARWLELMNAGFGPQMTNVVVKAEEAAVYTGKEIGVPEKLIRDKAEREQIQKAIAETQQTQANRQQQQTM